MSIHHPPHTISARNGLYLHFEGSEMADTYRITSHGPNFIINHDAGMTVGVYGTRQEALREIEACEQDDFMLETARSLVKNAVDVLVQTQNIDRRAACGWIREAAG
jgi:hypothetical protein